MSKIKDIRAFEILDSRGNPTLEVEVITKKSSGTASVPSGASTGDHEAVELRDGAMRYLGLGVQKAIRNIQKIIKPALKGIDCRDQHMVDQVLISLDGTKNKSKLGANAILGVSLACARAAANGLKNPLYRYLHELAFMKQKMKLIRIKGKTTLRLPRGFFNVINGGKHADNNISFQEFMIVPKMKTFKENLRAASEVYHILKKDIHTKYGSSSTNVGDEGGFAPPMKTTHEVLDMLMKSIKDAGYLGSVQIAMDVAASEFYLNGWYMVDGKKMSTQQLFDFYFELLQEYPIISIEDPFEQENFAAFNALRVASGIQIVGDDVTVTNSARICRAIEENSCNCLLLKVNQIGTLSEALEAAHLAFEAGWGVMVSHRSGETNDTFIADLAVALGCGMIKSGAPCRGERVAKYNRLMRIEEEL